MRASTRTPTVVIALVASFASVQSFAPVVRSPSRVAAVMSVDVRNADVLPGGPASVFMPQHTQQTPEVMNRVAARSRANAPPQPAAPSLPERVEALCGMLDVHGAMTLIEQVDTAVAVMGLQKEIGEMPLEQKVDACFQEIRPMVGAVTAVINSLNMTKSASLVETADRAVHMIGLGQDVAALPLSQKIDACLQTLGTSPNAAAPMAIHGMNPHPRKAQLVRERMAVHGIAPYMYGTGGYGGYASPYGGSGRIGHQPYSGPYSYGGYIGPTRMEARVAARTGVNLHDHYSASGYYAAYDYPGGRQDRLYDRALHTWSYDPYNAVGNSWDAWCDFFG